MAKEVKLPDKTSIPANWSWIDMGMLTIIKSGYPFNSKQFSYDPENRQPLIRIRDVVRGFTETFTDEACSDEFIIRQGEILIGMDGDFNVNRWRSDVALLNQRVCQIESSSELLLSDFLYYYLPIPLKLINEATPSVTVKHLSTKTLNKTPFPLPPLAEQRRIVACIESLFEKLEYARELVQTALDSFETRKAAILHKAFTGELTAQWRAKHGVGMNSWEEMPFDKMCLSIYDGDHMPPPKKAEGIPFIVISNINQGYISLENTRFVPSDYYKSLSETRIPKRGDVLYSIVGSFGIPALVDIDEPFCFQRHIALFRPNSTVLNSKALWYILQTQEIYNLADNLATGTAQRTVPIRGLRKMLFMFPSLPEQQEIVRILDSLLEKEQKAKEQLEPVLDQIDLMKKSILARAFRGELGTNDPSEESALGLLEEILK
ncbi:restriction endonuclease subunit S [Christensenellaceae bacterium OttesenSCG-928-L17]|nr:restriction endonuclease subunit S [Christensenellaceae bacterium OttesenSCG-928-L17]